MGTVFKPKITRPMPVNAVIVDRAGRPWAEWRDASGKVKRAPTTGSRARRPGIVVEATTFTAKFRDGNGVVRKVATRCRTREAAKQVLAELELRAEKVWSGVLSQRESDVSEHLRTPIEEHVEAYLKSLANRRGKGAHPKVSSTHVANVRRGLFQVIKDCGFRTAADLDREAVGRWASASLRRSPAPSSPHPRGQAACRPPGPRTINSKLMALTAFGNWLVADGRLLENPFAKLTKLDEADDVRRKRRSLTADEFGRLLQMARWRPLAEHGRTTVRGEGAAPSPRSRSTWRKSPLTFEGLAAAVQRARAAVRPDVVERLELVGWERALIYEMCLTTGLRKGEVASLTIDSLDLTATAPTVTLRGIHAKNGKRCSIPLRPDVAAHLHDWVESQRRRAAEQRVPMASGMPLFRVPTGLIRIFDKDLAAAGIPKVDERGRRVDVHAMRTTFNTQLAVAGIDPRIAMAAMRVSSLDLVLKTYADEKLLAVAEAVGSLPAPPAPASMLVAQGSPTPEAARGVVPIVVPAPGQGSPSEGAPGKAEGGGRIWRLEKPRAAKPQKERGSVVLPRIPEERAKGLEPSTSSLGS